MRPFHQTMCHCCQLIPLQITLPFIVSSLALSLSLFLSLSLVRSLFYPAVSQPRCWSSLSFLSLGYKPSPFSPIFPRTFCFSSLSFLSALFIRCPFWILFLSFALFLFRAVFLFRFHFVLLILLLPILRRPHRDTEDLSPWLKGAPGIAVIKEIVPISIPPSIIASIVCGWLKGATLMHSHAL